MTIYYCACGRQTVQVSENVSLTSLRCKDCPSPTASWYSRLDEWQHRHVPDCDQRPVAHRVWRLLWRPLCDFADWRYGVPPSVIAKGWVGRGGMVK